MARGRCSVRGCSKVISARGWCRKHYVRWQRHGDPLFVQQIQGDDDARFMAKVRKRRSGCWKWIGYVNPGGYGTFGSGGHRGPIVLAHRWAYERWIGPIPQGWTVDHLCHNGSTCTGGVDCRHRRCVNPAHLGITATLAENVARSPNALQHRTSCIHGHPYDATNTGWAGKWRYCKRCHSLRETARQARQRERARDRMQCANGHLYEPDNLIMTKDGRRLCRICAKRRPQRRSS